MNRFNFSTVLALLIFTEVGQGDPLDTWTSHYPAPPRLPLGKFSSVSYGNGQFVAVGPSFNPSGLPASAVIVTSADGANWTQHASSVGLLLDRIAYGKGLFVAVAGAFGTSAGVYSGTIVIVTSADGVNWVQRFSGQNTRAWDHAIA